RPSSPEGSGIRARKGRPPVAAGKSCSRGRKAAVWPATGRSDLRQIKLERRFRHPPPGDGATAGVGVAFGPPAPTPMRCRRSNRRKEDSMYAAIRQGKAKTGMAEELTRRIKEGAIPIISDVEGFMGYYVVYAPDDTVTAISLFNNFAS